MRLNFLSVTLFADLWSMPDRATAKAFIDDWLSQAQDCVIGPFIRFANTVKAHLSGILQYFDSGLTIAVLEGITNKVQLAKRRHGATAIQLILPI